MNQVLEFLSQYYLYVAAGSLGIIIILILIIFIGNKRRRKKENDEMANIGDIKTGTIDEVSNSIKENNQSLQPHDMGELTQSIPDLGNNPTPIEQEVVPEPVVPEITPEVVSEPVVPEITPEVVSEPVIPEITPEVVPEPVVPEITPEVVSEPVIPDITPEVVPEPVIPEITPEVVPEPVIPEIKQEESLEVFGIEEKPKGSAVSGFSSVNVEK